MIERPESASKRSARGRVHVWTADPNSKLGGRISTELVALARLDADGEGRNRLWGRFVRVRNAAVVNQIDAASGTVHPVALGDARADEHGDFDFDPSRGGARVDKFTLRSEKYIHRYVQAARFGEVNTYYHVDRIAARIDELLHELGRSSLPRVDVVVNAHHAAVLLPDGKRDGILRFERWVPFQGGHYRLPNRAHGIAEHEPLSPTGEIHLGPGWKLIEHGALVESAGGRYRHVGSHNAGTIYHEYGHHITRHTADFRVNALRPTERQSNLKTELDEAFCDYFCATMLGSPHIWAWHRRHDERGLHRRSLLSKVTMEDYDEDETSDPHRNGTIWAAALWDLRGRMHGANAIEAHECDKLLVQALLLIGSDLGEDESESIKHVRRARASLSRVQAWILRADEMLFDARNRESILGAFGSRGIQPTDLAVERVVAPKRSRRKVATPHVDRRDTTGDTLQFHSGWEETPESLAQLEIAKQKLARHVAQEDIAETKDIFARGELGATFRELGEPPLSVLATGDTMLGGRSRSIIEERGIEYPFKALRPLLQRAAIVFGNQEGPIAISARRQPRNFSYRVDPRMALALKRAGFHVMTLANNHLMDCGRRGVVESLAVLKQNGVLPLGAGLDEREAHEPVILDAHGVRVGMLGYYWNRRTAARGSLPGSAMDPPEALLADIRALRERVDRVVVTVHWGVPYVREPTEADRAKARFAIDCGADAVIGHHTHVIQPFEIHRDRPIFFGIGNFAFGSGNSKGEGLAVGLRFEANRTRVEIYPLYVKNRDPRVNYQPKLLRGDSARHALRRLIDQSGEFGAMLELHEFRATLDLPYSRQNQRIDRVLSDRA